MTQILRRLEALESVLVSSKPDVDDGATPMERYLRMLDGPVVPRKRPSSTYSPEEADAWLHSQAG
jgi:hypothetical protein